ncbi:RNA polymerase sigma factor [Fulvivirga lutea]|uniref:RNA polymerase sigma factor n=1 Tax=Fulvivirga lutea TaxID=2810512 RepID=A0A974WGI4_9BACT|nr:RNA polymerase sigma factor [Fulvivirga lutea]QSE97444.1 RNA polymerase sigma factor [Fulvivirga lutea]
MRESKVFDELLIIRCNEGDQKAFELLVKRWNKKLLAFTYRYVKDFEVSKDIVQDSWVSIFNAMHKLKEPAKFHSWAFRITYNKIIDQFKKSQKDHDIRASEEIQHPNEESEQPDVRTYLNKLPPEQKTVLTLFYLEELSIMDISKVLDIPIGTVKSRIFYAREKLKEIINKKSYENHG